MEMPWGMHRGVPLTDVPLGYLGWVLEECDNVRPHLYQAILQEVARRLGLSTRRDRPPPPPRPATGISPAEMEGRVKTWFRRLALDFHPDRGRGTDAQMAALNEAHDRLLEALDLRR